MREPVTMLLRRYSSVDSKCPLAKGIMLEYVSVFVFMRSPGGVERILPALEQRHPQSVEVGSGAHSGASHCESRQWGSQWGSKWGSRVRNSHTVPVVADSGWPWGVVGEGRAGA